MPKLIDSIESPYGDLNQDNESEAEEVKVNIIKD